MLYYAHSTGASFWLALAHDISKFSVDEFDPYAQWFYGAHGLHDLSPDNCQVHTRLKLAFDYAWGHHKSVNKHHPEYWLRDWDGGPLPMPDKYIREMIADWRGAGRAITGHDDLKEWWGKNRNRFIFHPVTRVAVAAQLLELGIE